ncbi:polysaccharide deacetylase family protein [Larkinella sp. VNQ87]|uniref:polysaccharide deacetylase family protein n=1 Tax=Larkinella sp. VNQ87 TaxID=3400921 RepID=UPI003C025918
MSPFTPHASAFGAFFLHARVDTHQKVMALTYDDGPTEKTARILAILDRLNIKATFLSPEKNWKTTALKERSSRPPVISWVTIPTPARPGSIILLHVMYDDRAESVKAIRGIVTGLRRQGYAFKTVNELLRYR